MIGLSCFKRTYYATLRLNSLKNHNFKPCAHIKQTCSALKAVKMIFLFEKKNKKKTKKNKHFFSQNIDCGYTLSVFFSIETVLTSTHNLGFHEI